MLNHIRNMQPEDLTSVVEVHMRSFERFFLTFLGPAFLREMYANIINDKSGISYIYTTSQQILGFAVGTDQPASFYRRLLQKRWWRFALTSLMPLMKRPSILPRLFRALSKHSQYGKADGCGILMSIAVLPSHQGGRIGQLLAQTFLQEAKQRGLRQVKVTTDRDYNDAANFFYQKLGFASVRTFSTPEGRIMNEYAIDLR